jgi:hypothetical protein
MGEYCVSVFCETPLPAIFMEEGLTDAVFSGMIKSRIFAEIGLV